MNVHGRIRSIFLGHNVNSSSATLLKSFSKTLKILRTSSRCFGAQQSFRCSSEDLFHDLKNDLFEERFKECLRNVLLKIIIKTYGRKTLTGVSTIREFLGPNCTTIIICYTSMVYYSKYEFSTFIFFDRGHLFRRQFSQGAFSRGAYFQTPLYVTWFLPSLPAIII